MHDFKKIYIYSQSNQQNMGQTETKKEAQQIIEQVQAPKVNHARFGNAEIVKIKEDEEAIKVKLPLASQKQFKDWKTALDQGPQNSEALLLPYRSNFQKEGICGSSGFVNVQYENFQFILADQISNRETLKQKFFEEPQLWYLLYTLLTAGRQMHGKGKKVGDIRPENIFINEDGQVKVANQLTWPLEQDNYEKTFYEKQPTYLAPEELKDIQFGKTFPTVDPIIAESFSIGLTSLDAATLSNSNPLYLKNNKFDYRKLENRLVQLKNVGYSELLNLVIDNLCDADTTRRCTCEQLSNWLYPYEQWIINLNPFEPETLPEKIMQTRNKNITYVPSMVQSQQPEFKSSPEKPRQQFIPINPPMIPVVPENKTEISSQQIVYTNQQPPSHGQTISQTYYQPIAQLPPHLVNQPQQQVQHQTFTSYKVTDTTYAQQKQLVQKEQVNEVIGEEPKQRVSKSKIQLDLDKIDQQLKMSRKMFPS